MQHRILGGIMMATLAVTGCTPLGRTTERPVIEVASPTIMPPQRQLSQLGERFSGLAESCGRTQSARLDAADAVMELLIKIRDARKDASLPEDPAITKAGNHLFMMMMSIYNGNLSESDCQLGTEIIMKEVPINLIWS